MTWSFYDIPLLVILILTVCLVFAVSEIAYWSARRTRNSAEHSDAGTLAGAALGLLALLVAFSFSIALSKYDARREAVLDEALALGSTANYAVMLPPRDRGPILAFLREYATVRIGLGVPYNAAKLRQDIARSIDLQNRLWRRAAVVAAAQPQSLPVSRFLDSLNELNNDHERRLTTLRVRIPVPVIIMLIATAMVAMGFVGFQAGLGKKHLLFGRAVMSLTLAALIMLIVDLDRPSRGLITISTQPLVDALNGMPR